MSKLNLGTLVLAKGKHSDRDDGVCLLEAVAFFAGERHSDAPVCVSPVLRAFGVNLNDILSDERRQELKPLIPKLVGTAGDGKDEARSYMALDWLIRTYAPAWLDLAGLTAEARALREFRRIADRGAANVIRPECEAARSAARSAADSVAYSVADPAADSVADSAADPAAYSAAYSVAYSAADPAADPAAYSVAYSVAYSAAYSAAYSVAYSVAYSAAYLAARSVADSAADSAARSALQPTVEILQISAIALFAGMINPALAA